jgi:hypothetical protein
MAGITPSEKTKNIIVVLEELRRLYDLKQDAITSLDNKAMSLFQGTSVILALFAVLQIALIDKDIQIPGYWITLIIIFALYISLTVLLLYSHIPIKFIAVIKSDWRELRVKYVNKLNKDTIKLLIANYIDRNRELDKKLKLKNIFIGISTILFILIMAGLFTLSFITVR